MIKCELITVGDNFINGRRVMYHENYDLISVVTPVKIDKYEQLLKQSKYDREKTEYLVKGLHEGFSIGYDGPEKVKMKSPNLKLTTGDELDLWNKVMKEVKLGRYAGPYGNIPFETYIQSPIGLVLKDGVTDTRLIFHLSYPRSGTKQSVNANTPEHLCKVKYPDLDLAILRCLQEGEKLQFKQIGYESSF